jgi:EAL domain-containing protein (putative c-di-GMP-specific phosphodiesterase class I)
MNDRALARLDTENSLRRAIDSGELILHYQPRLDLELHSIAGVEALVRWDHPTKGLIYPSHFVPLAEEAGIIDTLGEWVLRSACRQMQSWFERGMPALRVSINISPLQLQSDRICTVVAQALAESGLDPALLELEITESSLMQNLEASRRTLAELQRMGILLSIDDFGTGYSSLSYLKRLPINTLKIDKSFVRDLSEDEDDASIVNATIAMAHRMHLRVVAEGVVSHEQLRFLKRLKCDEIQGYLLCQPLPSDEAESFLRTCRLRGIECRWSR